MTKISFPAPAKLNKIQQSSLMGVQQNESDLTTAESKNKLLYNRLFHSLNAKSPESILDFCKKELVGISALVNAQANKDNARCNLQNNYKQLNSADSKENQSVRNSTATQIQELLDLFTNREDGNLAYQNVNRVAAKYTKSLLEIIKALGGSDFLTDESSTENNKEIIKNINLILRESNKWYRENYIKNVKAKKNENFLTIQLGRNGGSMGNYGYVTIHLAQPSLFKKSGGPQTQKLADGTSRVNEGSDLQHEPIIYSNYSSNYFTTRTYPEYKANQNKLQEPLSTTQVHSTSSYPSNSMNVSTRTKDEAKPHIENKFMQNSYFPSANFSNSSGNSMNVSTKSDSEDKHQKPSTPPSENNLMKSSLLPTNNTSEHHIDSSMGDSAVKKSDFKTPQEPRSHTFQNAEEFNNFVQNNNLKIRYRNFINTLSQKNGHATEQIIISPQLYINLLKDGTNSFKFALKKDLIENEPIYLTEYPQLKDKSRTFQGQKKLDEFMSEQDDSGDFPNIQLLENFKKMLNLQNFTQVNRDEILYRNIVFYKNRFWLKPETELTQYPVTDDANISQFNKDHPPGKFEYDPKENKAFCEKAHKAGPEFIRSARKFMADMIKDDTDANKKIHLDGLQAEVYQQLNMEMLVLDKLSPLQSALRNGPFKDCKTDEEIKNKFMAFRENPKSPENKQFFTELVDIIIVDTTKSAVFTPLKTAEIFFDKYHELELREKITFENNHFYLTTGNSQDIEGDGNCFYHCLEFLEQNKNLPQNSN